MWKKRGKITNVSHNPTYFTRGRHVAEGGIQEPPHQNAVGVLCAELDADLVGEVRQLASQIPRVEGEGVGEGVKYVQQGFGREARDAALVLLEDDFQVGGQRAGRGELRQEHQHSEGGLAHVAASREGGGQVKMRHQVVEELFHSEAEEAIPPPAAPSQAVPHRSAHPRRVRLNAVWCWGGVDV